MIPLTNLKRVCKCAGLVNYYLNMWDSCSHILDPLTNLTSSKVKFKWSDDKNNLYEHIKLIMDRNTLLYYPGFNKLFKKYFNATNFQLGGGISQEGKPIYFYSRKLAGSQKNYMVVKKELLIIVKTLGWFELYF